MSLHHLSMRPPEACSLGKSIAFNKHSVGIFFAIFKEAYARFSTFSDGSRVYNLDETSTTTVHKPRTNVTKKRNSSNFPSH